MYFFKKIFKNKMIFLSACVTVVSLTYMGIQRIIANYNFKSNNEIITENKETFLNSDSNVNQNKENESSTENEGMTISEEIDMELEEINNVGEVKAEIGEDKDELGESVTESKIYVYITGEVNNPGVVVLNEGSRIVDAINSAGGTTINADISKVNLVFGLEDGMKVNIPNKNDLNNNSDFEYITMNSGDGKNNDYSSGSSSLGSGVGSQSNKDTSKNTEPSNYSKKYEVVNINTATQTELETLPGIGPSLALKIINYRKVNGKFSAIEQIKEVSGIGESKFESLKNYITI